MSLATEAGILLAYTALVVGCYAFSWRSSNHAMEKVEELVAALNKLQLDVADRLARIETKLKITHPK